MPSVLRGREPSIGWPREKNTATLAMAKSRGKGLLNAAAAEVGLSRAFDILSEQRDAVRAVLGG